MRLPARILRKQTLHTEILLHEKREHVILTPSSRPGRPDAFSNFTISFGFASWKVNLASVIHALYTSHFDFLDTFYMQPPFKVLGNCTKCNMWWQGILLVTLVQSRTSYAGCHFLIPPNQTNFGLGYLIHILLSMYEPVQSLCLS